MANLVSHFLIFELAYAIVISRSAPPSFFSLNVVRMMNRLRWLLVICLLGLAIGPSARADDKTSVPPKTVSGVPVEVIKDQPYRTGKDADPAKNKLDLYLPRGKKDFPVLFFVHGGAWKAGDKKLYGRLGQMFAGHGIGTVIISYRLSPGVQHPAHIQDVARAFAWTHENIQRYGGRPDQIFVSGHSAGGHLVALLATDESYLKAEKLSIADIKGVIPISGVYTIPPSPRLKDAFGTDPEACRNASPLSHVKGKEPPFLVIYADKDMAMLDKSAERMHAALQKAKDEASILQVKDRTHVSIIVRIANEDDPAAKAILDFIANHTPHKQTAGGGKTS
jgi:acetyl esterase/lipase